MIIDKLSLLYERRLYILRPVGVKGANLRQLLEFGIGRWREAVIRGDDDDDRRPDDLPLCLNFES